MESRYEYPWHCDTDQVLEDLHYFRCMFRETIKDDYAKFLNDEQQKLDVINDRDALKKFLTHNNLENESKFIISKLDVDSIKELKNTVIRGVYDEKLTNLLKELLCINDFSSYRPIQQPIPSAHIPSAHIPSAHIYPDFACTICIDNAPNTVFLPCKHTCCEKCFPKLNECHICKASIETTIKIFV